MSYVATRKFTFFLFKLQNRLLIQLSRLRKFTGTLELHHFWFYFNRLLFTRFILLFCRVAGLFLFSKIVIYVDVFNNRVEDILDPITSLCRHLSKGHVVLFGPFEPFSLLNLPFFLLVDLISHQYGNRTFWFVVPEHLVPVNQGI